MSADRPPRASIRVLFAVGLPQIRDMLRHALVTDGRFDVSDVSDGPATVEAALATQPDVVVLDLGLPHFEGASAVARIVRECPHTKVVVLSGVVEMGAEVLRAGAHSFFETTAPAHELPAAIAELVARDN
ncbi:MAG: response regulator transcription factor [Actinomycetota bacterium]|nr:response regulator transcription factor [Actinomycetota bacterium]